VAAVASGNETPPPPSGMLASERVSLPLPLEFTGRAHPLWLRLAVTPLEGELALVGLFASLTSAPSGQPAVRRRRSSGGNVHIPPTRPPPSPPASRHPCAVHTTVVQDALISDLAQVPDLIAEKALILPPPGSCLLPLLSHLCPESLTMSALLRRSPMTDLPLYLLL